MPITPFHFGPGMLLGVGVRASLVAFLLTNIAIDVESGYHLVTHAYPIHTFLHTAVGATLIALVVLGAVGSYEAWARRANARNPDGTRRSPRSYLGMVIGAFAGAWSHVALDAIMHADVEPFAPWSSANPLHGAVSFTILHVGCVSCASLAILIFARRLGRVSC